MSVRTVGRPALLASLACLALWLWGPRPALAKEPDYSLDPTHGASTLPIPDHPYVRPPPTPHRSEFGFRLLALYRNVDGLPFGGAQLQLDTGVVFSRIAVYGFFNVGLYAYDGLLFSIPLRAGATVEARFGHLRVGGGGHAGVDTYPRVTLVGPTIAELAFGLHVQASWLLLDWSTATRARGLSVVAYGAGDYTSSGRGIFSVGAGPEVRF